MIHAQEQREEWLEPLRSYYASAGRPLPAVTLLAGPDVPRPYRDLLVHEEDMTSVLERYHGEAIGLRVLRAGPQDGAWTREVVLVASGSGKPVEFGAIRIHLDRFGPRPRGMILEGRRPLGGILKEEGLSYRCRPAAFFRVRSDTIINTVLELDGEQPLFGRYNVLYDPTDRPLAEVVEILPPAGPGTVTTGEP